MTAIPPKRRPALFVPLRFLALAAILSSTLLAPRPVAAQNLLLNVFDPVRVGVLPGSLLTFSGTVTNNTGAALNATDLFLNFSGFDPAVVGLTPLLGNPDFTLGDGATSAPVELFRLDLGSNALFNQTYVADAFVQDVNGNTSNVVTVAVATVPEPATALLLGPGLAVLAALARKRRGGPTRRRRFCWGAFFLCTLLCTLALRPLPVRAQSSPVRFATGVAGQAFLNAPPVLLVELPLINSGSTAAANVQITGITLGGAARLSPAAFPVSLGGIAAGGATVLETRFSRSALTAGARPLLTVQGTYDLGGTRYGFAVNQYLEILDPGTPDGSTEFQSDSASGIDVSGFFPPDTSPNMEENEDLEAPTPVGPFRSQPISSPTAVESPVLATTGVRPLAETDNLRFARSTDFNNSIPGAPPNQIGRKSSEVLDPSVASSGDVVLCSGNWYGAISLDNGRTFRALNPSTLFPAFAGGRRLVGDQVIHYAPSIDRFVWLMLSTIVNGTNVIRIAVARPAALAADIRNNTNTAWRVWDYDSAFFRVAANPTRWMDFPDLAVSNQHLYISAGLFERMMGGGDTFRGHLEARIGLNDIANVAAPVVSFGDSTVGGITRVTQNTSTRAHIATHLNTSRLRIESWDQAQNFGVLREVNHGSYTSDAASYVSLTPSGVDWLSGPIKDRVLGATERIDTGAVRKEVWFAWTAGRNATYTQPYILVVRYDALTFNNLAGKNGPIEEKVIWNPAFAWAFPSLATNSNNEVGIAYMTGPLIMNNNPVSNPSYGAGILTGTSHFPILAFGTAAKPRYGDYLTIRQHSPATRLFSAAGCVVINDPMDPAHYDLRYALYGRASDVP